MKLLIVIDMQNDFIDGALGTNEALRIIPKVQAKLAEYRDKGFPVIFTRDTHSEEYLNTQEGRKLPVKHCVYESQGWNISSKLEVADSKVINKPSFGSLELADYIGKYYPDMELELIGICTDICVISNAIILKAAFPEINITVDASCCAGVTIQSHRNALEAMKMCQINIVNEDV